MSRRALLIALAASFITGSAVGLIGGILFVHRAPFLHAPHLPLHERPGGGRFERGRRPEGPSARDMVEHLSDELSLSPEQAERILVLVRASRRQVQAERDSVHARILLVLTPEQRERFQSMRRPHRLGGGPPPHEDDRGPGPR